MVMIQDVIIGERLFLDFVYKDCDLHQQKLLSKGRFEDAFREADSLIFQVDRDESIFVHVLSSKDRALLLLDRALVY